MSLSTTARGALDFWDADHSHMSPDTDYGDGYQHDVSSRPHSYAVQPAISEIARIVEKTDRHSWQEVVRHRPSTAVVWAVKSILPQFNTQPSDYQ